METLSIDELIRIETAGWDALCSSTAGAFYEALMTSEAVMILVDGTVLDRATIARSLEDSPPWDAYDLSDFRRIAIGPDSAALVYRARATRAGVTQPFVAYMASVYTVLDGRPRLALYQQTLLTP
ncbi:nuclear transport factor 2 family protein [Leifsonia sp. SIMBA_070]|uniref:nuclear transport factor 2 family protein n=1 Tax=Leifsonia sp. SIMBA_070 TaxID=3085810 RepID=UPI003978F1FC